MATQLIKDGSIDDGLRLMEFDVETTPGKAWLIRKTAQACLNNGRPEKALVFATKGLELNYLTDRVPTIRGQRDEDVIPSFGLAAFRGLRPEFFDLGHVSQAIFASLPFPLRTVQLSTIKFATGDAVRNFGDQFLDN